MGNRKRLINLNCLLYAIVVFLFAGKLIRDFISTEAIHSILYYCLVGAVPLITLIIMIGLLGMKDWARICSIVWNIGIASIIILLHIVSLFFFADDQKISDAIFSYLDWEIIVHIALGLCLIFIAVNLSSTSYKERFRKKG